MYKNNDPLLKCGSQRAACGVTAKDHGFIISEVNLIQLVMFPSLLLNSRQFNSSIFAVPSVRVAYHAA